MQIVRIIGPQIPRQDDAALLLLPLLVRLLMSLSLSLLLLLVHGLPH